MNQPRTVPGRAYGAQPEREDKRPKCYLPVRVAPALFERIKEQARIQSKTVSAVVVEALERIF